MPFMHAGLSGSFRSIRCARHPRILFSIHDRRFAHDTCLDAKNPAPTRTAACHSRRLLAEDALYFRRESPDEITGIDAIFGSGWKQRCPQSIWKHLDPRHPFNPGMRGIPHGLCRWVESAERHTFSPPFKEVLTLEPVHLLQATRIGEYAG